MKDQKCSSPLKGNKKIAWNCFIVAMGIIGVGLIISAFGLVAYEKSLEPSRRDKIRSEFSVTDYQPEKTFVVVDPVTKLDEVDMGWVIVEATESKYEFFAIVTPMREISVGSEVKISWMRHHSSHHFIGSTNFFIVVQ